MTHGGTTEHEMQTTYACSAFSSADREGGRPHLERKATPPKLISTGTPDRRREQTSEQ